MRRRKRLTTPYKYQKVGVKKIVDRFGGRALLADEMGLGKTPQALWSAQKLRRRSKRKKSVIIVCPANLKWQWQREAEKHARINATILEGRTPGKKPLVDGRHYIINYDILGREGRWRRTWLNKLKDLKPGTVIIDEVQYISNPQTVRTRAVRALCKRVPYVIGLGGTGGLENCPAELFPILNIIAPETFDSFHTFAMRYCAPRRTFWGWEFKGATNLGELHELLKETCMVRRLKKNVLKDLPPKQRSVIPVNIENKKEYQEAETDFIKWLRKKSKRKASRASSAERLVQVGYLKRLAAQLKMKSVYEWIDNFLSGGEEKLIVFGVHRSVLNALHERYRGQSVLVTGSTTGRKRQEAVDRFNGNRKCRLFFGNINAAGVGWSCTSASTVLFVELSWTPGKHVQAEDRIHGIKRGVKGRRAAVYYLVARGTIEEKLVALLQSKQDIIDQTLDGKLRVSNFDILDQLETELLRAA